MATSITSGPAAERADHFHELETPGIGYGPKVSATIVDGLTLFVGKARIAGKEYLIVSVTNGDKSPIKYQSRAGASGTDYYNKVQPGRTGSRLSPPADEESIYITYNGNTHHFAYNGPGRTLNLVETTPVADKAPVAQWFGAPRSASVGGTASVELLGFRFSLNPNGELVAENTREVAVTLDFYGCGTDFSTQSVSPGRRIVTRPDRAGAIAVCVGDEHRATLRYNHLGQTLSIQ